MRLNKKFAGFAAVAVAAIATLSLAGAANATPPVSTSVSPTGLVYGCVVPDHGSTTPILDWHGAYTAGKKCGAGHQLVVWTAGTKAPTGPAGPVGPKGATGATGATGPAGPAGADGTDAQALPYGTALVDISRGGGTPGLWGSFTTTLGSPAPMGDQASGSFRMSCSAAQAPCVVTVKAYANVGGVKVYPRLNLDVQDYNAGGPETSCEYADGVNNDGGSLAVGNGAANATAVPLGVGGTLDCGETQTLTGGVVTELDLPTGRYNFNVTFYFTK